MQLKIILADDHPIVLTGASGVIKDAGIGAVVATATSPSELVMCLARHACDVLVTDLMTTDTTQGGGFDAICRIRRQYPTLAIVLLSATTEVATLRAAQRAGVLGVVDKAASLAGLPAAIHAASQGNPYITLARADLMRGVDHERQRSSTPRYDMAESSQLVSLREAEVLRLLGSGLTVSQIAHRTNRTTSTVSRQKRDAMRKLGLSTDATLFDYLLSRKIQPL